jgi:hypothetical protein
MSAPRLLAFACAVAAVGCNVDRIPQTGPDTPTEGKIGLFEPHSTPDAGPPPPCMCVRPNTTGTTTGAGGTSGSSAAGSGGNNALVAIAGIGLPSPLMLPAQDVIGGMSGAGVGGAAGTTGAVGQGGQAGLAAAVGGMGDSGGTSAAVAGAGGMGAEARGCNMSVAFTTVPPATLTGPGKWDTDGRPHSYAVVWIETPNKALVKTLSLWAETLYVVPNLVRYWYQNPSCCSPDVIAMPTLTSHSPETVTWDCRDEHMNTVPDGDYVLWLEAQVDEAHHLPALSFPFTKSGTAFTLNPPPEPPQTAMTITYTPLPSN